MTIPQESDQRWSLDFVSDALVDGRRFRVLCILDDFTLACLIAYDTALSALLLEQRTFDTLDREPRDMAWRAASYAYLDRLGDAEKCAGVFLKAVSTRWCGDQAAGAADYVNWLVDVSYLSEERDISRLRDGLKRARLASLTEEVDPLRRTQGRFGEMLVHHD